MAELWAMRAKLDAIMCEALATPSASTEFVAGEIASPQSEMGELRIGGVAAAEIAAVVVTAVRLHLVFEPAHIAVQ